jgi:hypothetical protein
MGWAGRAKVVFVLSAISLEAAAAAAWLGPEGIGGWRCIAVDKLCQVELWAGDWRTEPRAGRQHCVEHIEFDTDAQSGDDPQKGQCGSCRSSRRASAMRSVAIEIGLCRSGRTRRAARAQVRRWPGGGESKMTGAGGGGKTVPLGHQEPIRCDA